jgi:hypothetical protein
VKLVLTGFQKRSNFMFGGGEPGFEIRSEERPDLKSLKRSRLRAVSCGL